MLETDKLVKMLVPVELIYSCSDKVDEVLSGQVFSECNKKIVPLVNLTPQMDAVRYLTTGVSSLNGYWDLTRNVCQDLNIDKNNWEKLLTKKVHSLGGLINKTLPVISNVEKDRLILEKGVLQCCLEKQKGKAWIDVLMSEETANKWNSRPTQRLDEEVKRQKRVGFYTPVFVSKYRPGFLRKLITVRPGVKRLDMMRNVLGNVRDDLSLLDIGCNNGFYVFQFERQGLSCTGIDYDIDHLNIANALKETYSSNSEFKLVKLQEYSPENKYDIGIGMTVFWHLLGWGDFKEVTITPEDLGAKIDELINHLLFWESGIRAEEEIELIKKHSSFKYYQKLGTTKATGVDDREFGVFTQLPLDETVAILRN